MYPNKNMNRFYKVIVVETLFGEWALIRQWARIGSAGTVREWLDTPDQVEYVEDSLQRQQVEEWTPSRKRNGRDRRLSSKWPSHP
jgi:predicted DNA-binding WGR domain protein